MQQSIEPVDPSYPRIIYMLVHGEADLEPTSRQCQEIFSKDHFKFREWQSPAHGAPTHTSGWIVNCATGGPV